MTRWLKKEGDAVETDEPLLDVSTDKVDTEILSPAARSVHAGEDFGAPMVFEAAGDVGVDLFEFLVDRGDLGGEPSHRFRSDRLGGQCVPLSLGGIDGHLGEVASTKVVYEPGQISRAACRSRLNEGQRVLLRETAKVTRAKEPRATAHDNDLPAVLAERLTTTHPDVLRELLATFIHTLMCAGAEARCGTGYGERSIERTSSRNGCRHRQFGTCIGSLDLAISKLRHSSYFPDWLLQRLERAERALTTVVATCYLLGVSTRRMDKLVETLGVTSLSKSQVSVMAKELDTAVEAFRTRPLGAGPYTFVAADALCSRSASSQVHLDSTSPRMSSGSRI